MNKKGINKEGEKQTVAWTGGQTFGFIQHCHENSSVFEAFGTFQQIGHGSDKTVKYKYAKSHYHWPMLRGWNSTEVAFVLPAQLSWVWIWLLVKSKQEIISLINDHSFLIRSLKLHNNCLMLPINVFKISAPCLWYLFPTRETPTDLLQ